MTAKTKVTRKYQVTIPKEVRKRTGVEVGDELKVIDKGDLIIMQKANKDKNIMDFAGCWEGYPEDPEKFMEDFAKDVVNMEDVEPVCFDTDVLIDFLRKPSSEVKKLIGCVFEKTLNAHITTINSFELWLGVFLSSSVTLSGYTEEFLSRFHVLGFDYKSSIEAGRISATLRKNGRAIEIRDLFVGCISKTNNMPIVTRNVKHYKRINGLKILTPDQALKTFNI